MAKQISFSYKDVDYVLRYTRRTVKQMEDEGFIVSDLQRFPATKFTELFSGAFKAQHPFIKQSLVNEIFEQFPNKTDLIKELGEMYAETLEVMMSDPKEPKLTWKVTET